MNLLVLLVNWYTLLYLESLSNSYDKINNAFYSHRNYKFREDLEKYLDIYTQKLNELFRDYIIVASSLEADAGAHGESHFKFPHSIWGPNEILYYKKEALIDTLKHCFRDFLWSNEFGGKPWYDAVASLSIKNPIVFIDHVVDLQHNTGTLLNKGYLGLRGMSHSYTEAFTVFLDAKKKLNLFSFSNIYGALMCYSVKTFYQRFQSVYKYSYLLDDKEMDNCSKEFLNSELRDEYLKEKWWGLFIKAKEWIEETEDELIAYEPLQWEEKGYLKVIELYPSIGLYEVNGIAPPVDAEEMKLKEVLRLK